MEQNVKDLIVDKYGSVNAFIDAKNKELQGELPLSRPYLYKLINHKIANPGIKTLNILAGMLGIEREKVYNEYSR